MKSKITIDYHVKEDEQCSLVLTGGRTTFSHSSPSTGTVRKNGEHQLVWNWPRSLAWKPNLILEYATQPSWPRSKLECLIRATDGSVSTMVEIGRELILRSTNRESGLELRFTTVEAPTSGVSQSQAAVANAPQPTAEQGHLHPSYGNSTFGALPQHPARCLFDGQGILWLRNGLSRLEANLDSGRADVDDLRIGVRSIGGEIQRISNRLSALEHISEQLSAISARLESLQAPQQRESDPRHGYEWLDGLRRLFGELHTPSTQYSTSSGSLPRARVAEHLLNLEAILRRGRAGQTVEICNELSQLGKRLKGAAPSELFAQAMEQRSADQAINALIELAQEQKRGEPLTDDHIIAQLIGIAKTLWGLQLLHDPKSNESSLLGQALSECSIELMVPLDEPYVASRHRLSRRESARPGEPINQVIEVIAPGFLRTGASGTKVIEKATVVISDY